MRTSFLPRALLSGLVLSALLAPPGLAQSEQPPAEKKGAKGTVKRTIAPKSDAPQTQTAPAAPTEKAKPAPGEAGAMTVSGQVSSVQVERNAIVIRSAASEFQVFLNPQSQVVRDGAAVDIKAVKSGDRVDSCHFNAKHVVQKMSLTPFEKIGTVPPPKPKP